MDRCGWTKKTEKSVDTSLSPYRDLENDALEDGLPRCALLGGGFFGAGIGGFVAACVAGMTHDSPGDQRGEHRCAEHGEPLGRIAGFIRDFWDLGRRV